MNIIVTGASRGIGYHTVLNLARDGEHRIFAIARNAAGLEKLQNEFSLINRAKLQCLSFDLAQKDYSLLMDAITDFFELDKGMSIDILMNNAGFLSNKLFMDLKDEDWNKTFEINVFAIVRLIKSLFPFFNRSQGSHIVNIGSMGGVQGTEKFPGLSAYSASKGALNILTESLAKEFENENIRVNAINPGAVQTTMFEQAFPGKSAQIREDEMGNFIAHFALNGFKYMNGRLNEFSFKS